MNDPILEVNNLRVSFRTYNGKVQAVRGIDFKLFEGETLAIVGESGSGKSVTTKAILGILPKNSIIEEGEILYKGEDLTKYKEKDFYKIRGKEISLIFQDPLSALNPIMKIGKQITEALVLREHMTKEQAKKRAIELMEMVGITRPEERFEQYPFQFSGGMRQRIVIAIALASNARIMICDEPTTALDVTIQAKILEEIKEIKRKFGEGFTKELRQMPEGEFAKAVIDSMEQLMFLKRIKDEQLVLYPAIGKLAGKYPKEYEEQLKENPTENQKEKMRNEQQMAGK